MRRLNENRHGGKRFRPWLVRAVLGTVAFGLLGAWPAEAQPVRGAWEVKALLGCAPSRSVSRSQ